MQAYETTYFATKNGEFYKDLPMLCTNVAAAAAWLDKQKAEDLQIFERFRVLANNGDIVSQPYEVTGQCVNILMDYYNGY
jgi:hypothetical protein